MTESKFCLSLSGIELPLLTITDPSDIIPISERKIVIVTARIHPGESNSSWVMHVKTIINIFFKKGFLQFIMGNS